MTAGETALSTEVAVERTIKLKIVTSEDGLWCDSSCPQYSNAHGIACDLYGALDLPWRAHNARPVHCIESEESARG